MFYNRDGSLEMPQNRDKSLEMPQSRDRSLEMPQNRDGSLEMSQNRDGRLEMSQNWDKSPEMPENRERSGKREKRKKRNKHKVRDITRSSSSEVCDSELVHVPAGFDGSRVVVETDEDESSADHMDYKTAKFRYQDEDATIDDTIHVEHDRDRRVTTIVNSKPPTPPPPPPVPPQPKRLPPTLPTTTVRRIPAPPTVIQPYRPPKVELVTVEVRVIVLHIVDIDTVNQNFLAEVFVQGKWLEPKLIHKSQQELNNIDLRKYWDPKLTISNIQGKCEDDVEWRSACARVNGEEAPLMFYRRRIRAKFSEVLELKQFPVDSQELSIHVTTERTEEEVSLVEDRARVSRVMKENFADENEFQLFEHVIVERRYVETDIISPHAINAKLLFKSHVLRKAGFFIWNVVLIIFLITLLSLTCYVIDRDDPFQRLSVIVKVLLTAVAFKWTMSYSLPKISYLTYLDIFILTSLLYLILQAILFAISALVDQRCSESISLWTDRIMFMVSLAMFIFYNLSFMICIVLKYNHTKSELLAEEKNYDERKEAVTNLVRTYSMRNDGKPRDIDSGYQGMPHIPNGSARPSRLP